MAGMSIKSLKKGQELNNDSTGEALCSSGDFFFHNYLNLHSVF